MNMMVVTGLAVTSSSAAFAAREYGFSTAHTSPQREIRVRLSLTCRDRVSNIKSAVEPMHGENVACRYDRGPKATGVDAP